MEVWRKFCLRKQQTQFALAKSAKVLCVSPSTQINELCDVVIRITEFKATSIFQSSVDNSVEFVMEFAISSY